jgi:hypothetical protein
MKIELEDYKKKAQEIKGSGNIREKNITKDTNYDVIKKLILPIYFFARRRF